MRGVMALLLSLSVGCGAAVQGSSRDGLAGIRQTTTTVTTTGSATITAPHVTTAMLNGSALQTRLMTGANGETYLGVWIDTTQVVMPADAQRAPMDVALVIDVSGSMAGEKIANARMAAVSLLESLSDNDIVSVYAFADSVTELAPPTVISNQTRAEMITRVQTLEPISGTNLYDGVRAGEARLFQAPATHPVRRLFLLSDGMATSGRTDQQGFEELAAQGTEVGAQITALGIGLDYSEVTLGALVSHSAGKMYHIDSPQDMAGIIQVELKQIQTTVASNTVLEIAPAPGVELLQSVSSPAEMRDGKMIVHVGNLYSGHQQDVLIRVKVNAAETGDHSLGMVRMNYIPTESPTQGRQEEIPLHFEVTADGTLAQASVNARVRSMVDIFEAGQASKHAAEELQRGNNAAAAQVLAAAEQQLDRAANDTNLSEGERSRVRRRLNEVQSNRAAASSAHSRPASRSVMLRTSASMDNAFAE